MDIENMRLSKTDFRFVMKWHKREGLIADITPRKTNADLRYIMGLFSDEVIKELKDRGYDINTLKLTIDKTPEAIQKHKDSNTLSREDYLAKYENH